MGAFIVQEVAAISHQLDFGYSRIRIRFILTLFLFKYKEMNWWGVIYIFCTLTWSPLACSWCLLIVIDSIQLIYLFFVKGMDRHFRIRFLIVLILSFCEHSKNYNNFWTSEYIRKLLHLFTLCYQWNTFDFRNRLLMNITISLLFFSLWISDMSHHFTVCSQNRASFNLYLWTRNQLIYWGTGITSCKWIGKKRTLHLYSQFVITERLHDRLLPQRNFDQLVLAAN